LSAGETGIVSPAVPAGDLKEALAADDDLMSTLEHALADWTRILQSVLLEEAQVLPQGTGAAYTSIALRPDFPGGPVNGEAVTERL
jgi:hypothetical protein